VDRADADGAGGFRRLAFGAGEAPAAVGQARGDEGAATETEGFHVTRGKCSGADHRGK